jgi:6-phosphogluconate dehydrogenase
VGYIADVRKALYAAKIVAYSQGFEQIAQASQAHGWGIDLAALARIWRGGCIIRARFLSDVMRAFQQQPKLPLLLADDFFAAGLKAGMHSWRRVVALAVTNQVPVPALSSLLAYVDGLRASRSTAALIQSQRDLFGAHSYERVDAPGHFHTYWAKDGTEIPA